MKMVVTTQAHFKMTTEDQQHHLLVDMKHKMAAYTEDVPLTRLPDEVALSFLGPSLVGSQSKECLLMLHHFWFVLAHVFWQMCCSNYFRKKMVFL